MCLSFDLDTVSSAKHFAASLSICSFRGPVGPRGAPPAQRWVADRAINVTIRSPITLGPNWDRFTPLVSLEYFVFSGSFDG